MRAILALMLTATQAIGAPCATRDVLVGALAGQWGETLQARALDAAGNLIEIWASAATRTWTLTVTNIAGITCVHGAGGKFETIPPGKPA